MVLWLVHFTPDGTAWPWLRTLCCVLGQNTYDDFHTYQSINNGKNEDTKIPHSMVIFLIKARRAYQDLSFQADPTRGN